MAGHWLLVNKLIKKFELGPLGMPRNICIVTEEYSGLNKSGGIGAASRGLCELLVSAGFAVDVIITDLGCSSKLSIDSSIYHGQNIIFLSEIVRYQKEIYTPVDEITKSYSIFLYVKDRGYSLIHFNEWLGSGFYTAMARKQGLLDSLIVSHLHGSSEWVRKHNNYSPTLEDLERESIERSQIENSDFVVSPSSYLMNWYAAEGVALPERHRIGWFLPQWNSVDSIEANKFLTVPALNPGASELIFFGRHEVRKGFELFISAVAALPPEIHPDLTFLGRFDRIRAEFSGSYALRKLTNYGGRIRFFDNLNQKEAMRYISTAKSALCVMPSLIENSPCVIGECFTIGASFIATDVGGTSELIDNLCADVCLAAPESGALSKMILSALVHGLPKVSSTLSPEKVKAEWLSWHNSTLSHYHASTAPDLSPLVSVCLTHYDRPEFLKIALQGLMAQTYKNVEIIIVDDGSKKPQSLSYLDEVESTIWKYPLKVVRSPNRYLGAARNLAAANANGEYLLFHDDDNFAEMEQISTFVAAAQSSGCDILTAICWIVRDGEDQRLKKVEYFPIGVGGSFSFFRNRFGDANALIRHSIFREIGGFTELRDVGWEDWEFFLRGYLKGAKIGVVPIPLFNYRVSHNGMLATGDIILNYERIYSVIDKEKPNVNSEVFRYIQANWVHSQAKGKTIHDFSNLIGAEIHKELMDLAPDSISARSKLSDLAFLLHRLPDAIEIGIGNFQQREKLIALTAAMSGPVVKRLGARSYFSPKDSDYLAVVRVRGWGFDKRGQGYLPNKVAMDGKAFGVFARAVEERRDVSQQFKLMRHMSVGFVLFAEPRPTLGLSEKISAIMRYRMSKPRVNVPILGAVRVHVDEIEQYSKVTLPNEMTVAWERLTIETNKDTLIALFFEDEDSIQETKLHARTAVFENTNRRAGRVSILLSSDVQVDIICEKLMPEH